MGKKGRRVFNKGIIGNSWSNCSFKTKLSIRGPILANIRKEGPILQRYYSLYFSLKVLSCKEEV